MSVVRRLISCPSPHTLSVGVFLISEIALQLVGVDIFYVCAILWATQSTHERKLMSVLHRYNLLF